MNNTTSTRSPHVDEFILVCNSLGIPWELSCYDGDGEVVYHFKNFDGGYDLDILEDFLQNEDAVIDYAEMSSDGVAFGQFDWKF